MKRIRDIQENDEITTYLVKRGILKQYLKAKEYLLSGNTKIVDLKIRQPKREEIWQFRITKKYRAFCYFEDDMLCVIEISDHQD